MLKPCSILFIIIQMVIFVEFTESTLPLTAFIDTRSHNYAKLKKVPQRPHSFKGGPVVEQMYNSYREYYDTDQNSEYYDEYYMTNIDNVPGLRDYDYEVSVITKPNSKNPKICPKGESPFSKQDLTSAVKYVDSKETIEANILKSVYLKTYELDVMHKTDIENLKEKIKHRPAHVKDILSNLKFIRTNTILPAVEELAFKLGEFKALEKNFNDTFTTFANLRLKVDRSQKICELNCKDDENDDIKFSRYTQVESLEPKDDSYYCGSVATVLIAIHTKLHNFQDQRIRELNKEINETDQLFKTELKKMENHIKEAAFAKFGRTMYNLLSLEDDYHHLMSSVNSDVVDKQLCELRKNMSEVNNSLDYLKGMASKYRQYCVTCKPEMRKRRSIPAYVRAHNPDLLDAVINYRISQINSKIHNKLADVLIFNDTIVRNITDDILTALESVQVSADSEIGEEINAYENMKQKLPNKTLAKLTDITYKVSEMGKSVRKILDFLSKYDT